MVNFYTNRELSRGLEINLAKWKRWSREFLPPDPLGGMQSGYARQYSIKEAFTVHLGGCLVSGLGFSIPEARQILDDLSGWIENRFFRPNGGKENAETSGVYALVDHYAVFIDPVDDAKDGARGFCYTIRGFISDGPARFRGYPIRQEHYVETSIPEGTDAPRRAEPPIRKILYITKFYSFFREKLR